MLVASKDTSRTNQLAVAAFEHWTDSTFPRGGITKILGPAGVREIELEAIALQYSPWSWTSKVCPTELIHPDRKKRFILDKPTINIDPEGCLDIDDVLSLWKETKTNWTLAISISDVSAYVELNPSLRFAEKIGQTLYTREGAIVRSMFPTRFATDTFSLLPGKERFVLTLFATWNGSSLSNFHWKECCLTNTASYSYSNCSSIKELDTTVLKQIVSSLGGDPTDSHSWIESLMLLYNSEAAAVLKKANAGLLRSHSEPEQKRLINYAALGLPIQELAYPAASYTDCQNETGHWGLRKGLYCHASSPIRRYADIIKYFLFNS
jgi:exoribonuclease R